MELMVYIASYCRNNTTLRGWGGGRFDIVIVASPSGLLNKSMDLHKAGRKKIPNGWEIPNLDNVPLRPQPEE